MLKLSRLTWFDTHCHLQDNAFNADRAQTFQRAKDAVLNIYYYPLPIWKIQEKRLK